MILQYIVLLLLPLVIKCDGVTKWNQFGLSHTVVTPYRNALTLLNTDILDKLININSIHGNRQLSILAHGLHCTAKGICANLQQATTANDKMKREIDLQIDHFSDSILKLEKEKKRLQSTSTVLNANIARVRENIRRAETEIHDKQQDLNAAQNEYFKAKEALDDARYCIGRKRRWAWFERNILEPLNDVGVALWRTGCSVVNSGGIDNAKDRLSISQNSLNEANNRLTNYQNQLAAENNNLVHIQSQLSNTNSQLVTQNQLLQQRRAEQTLAETLAAQFKMIELHLDIVSTPSTKLIEELNMLVGFDTLIDPLKAIYNELLSERLIEQDIFVVSPEKIQQVKKKLAWLEKKLPQVDVLQEEFQGPCVSKTLDSDDLGVESKLWDDEETPNDVPEWWEHNYQTTPYNEVYDFEWKNETILNDTTLSLESDSETTSSSNTIPSEEEDETKWDYTTLSPELDSETTSSSETFPSEEEDETKWDYTTLSPESDTETISSSEILPSNDEDEIHDGRYRRDLLGRSARALAVFDADLDLSPLKKQLIIDEHYENTLATAPVTIYLLGQLMVYSSRVDFSLLTYTKKWTFTRLRNPQSFRATLAQIANEGWKAFMGAHSAMNKIQLNMQQIPRHIQIARKLVKSDMSFTMLSRLLPKSLRHLTRIGRECVSLSANTSYTFDDVYKLLMDVEEATIASKGGHEGQQKLIQDEFNISRIELARKESQKKKLDEELAEAKMSVKNAREELSHALSKIPTGMEVVLHELCYTVIGVIGDIGKLVSGGGSQSNGLASGGTSSKRIVPFSVQETLGYVACFGKSLKSFIDTMTKNSSMSPNYLSSMQISFQMWSNMIKKTSDNGMKEQASQLLKRGIDSLIEITEAVETGNNITEENKQMLTSLFGDVQKYQVAQETVTADNPMSMINPSNSRATNDNPKFIVQTRQRELRNIQQLHEIRNAEVRKLSDDITDLVLRMTRLGIDEIHFKDIIEVLHQAVRLLSVIKKNWSELVIFFNNIATGIEVSITNVLQPFLDYAEEAPTAHKNAIDRRILIQSIETLGKNVVDESRLIFLISRTYVDVSTKYLLKKLAGLSKLMLTNEKERGTMLEQLKNEEEATEKEVRELISQRRRVFQEHASKREKQLENLHQQIDDGDEDDGNMIDEANELLNNVV